MQNPSVHWGGGVAFHHRCVSVCDERKGRRWGRGEGARGREVGDAVGVGAEEGLPLPEGVVLVDGHEHPVPRQAPRRPQGPLLLGSVEGGPLRAARGTGALRGWGGDGGVGMGRASGYLEGAGGVHVGHHDGHPGPRLTAGLRCSGIKKTLRLDRHQHLFVGQTGI